MHRRAVGCTQRQVHKLRLLSFKQRMQLALLFVCGLRVAAWVMSWWIAAFGCAVLGIYAASTNCCTQGPQLVRFQVRLSEGWGGCGLGKLAYWFCWGVPCVSVWVGLTVWMVLWVLLSANPYTAYNPLVSKHEILKQIPAHNSLNVGLVLHPGDMDQFDFSEPLVFKPNTCSTDGRNVKIIRSRDEAAKYLNDRTRRRRERDTLVQKLYRPSQDTDPNCAHEYCGSDYEVSLFYYRYPGWLGRNGGNLKTVGLRQRTRITILQMEDWKTDTLRKAIDAIADTIPGFNVGRLDLRYKNQDDFVAGKDVKVMEVNLGIPLSDYGEQFDWNFNSRVVGGVRLRGGNSEEVDWVTKLRAKIGVVTTFVNIFTIGLINIVRGDCLSPFEVIRVYLSMAQRGFECSTAQHGIPEHFMKAIP